MSSNDKPRKILHAKRGNDRHVPSYHVNKTRAEDDEVKRGLKRQQAPTKNIANDRLKKLRMTLNQEVQAGLSKPSSSSEAFIKQATDLQPKGARGPSKSVKRSLPTSTESDLRVKQTKQSLANEQQSRNQKKNIRIEKLEVGETPPQVNSLSIKDTQKLVPVNANPAPVTPAPTTLQKFSFIASTSPIPLPSFQVLKTNEGQGEAMEWDQCDEETQVPEPKPSTSNSENIKTKVEPELSSQNSDLHLLVIDTNIFLSHMSLIRDIVENTKDYGKLVIYLPWMVNEELDYFKEDKVSCPEKFKSQSAIKYINYALMNRKGRIIGQTINEFNKQDAAGKSPDNKIISCCLQLMQKNKNIIFLSDDFNARNKAMVHGIRAYSYDQFISQSIGRKVNILSKAQTILDTFTELCWKIIVDCVKDAYGENWSKLNLLGTKPSSIKDCLKIFEKYWLAVFQEHLLKNFNLAIKQFSQFLKTSQNDLKDDSSQSVKDLVRHCVRICVYLKDVEQHKTSVEETIRELNCILES